MTIRLAEPRDIPGMISLLYQVGGVHHEIRPDIFREKAIKYTPADLEQLLKDETKPIFVYDDGGFVAGYCFCQHKIIEDTPLSVGRQELYIDDLCVDENHRRMGIANALYSHTLSYAKATGCNMVTLHVWNGNDGAVRFYEKMGMTTRYFMMEVPVEE